METTDTLRTLLYLLHAAIFLIWIVWMFKRIIKIFNLSEKLSNPRNVVEAAVGEYRIIPKGTKIWSINNQRTFRLENDELVEITHTTISSDVVFVVPVRKRSPLFYTNTEELIKDSKDEWSVRIRNTKRYVKK